MNSTSPVTGRLNMVYYTDPLCCWSWAFEKAWQQLKQNYSMNVRYCMGGLLSDWNNYNDQLNSVSKPIQMGPVWMQAGQLSGTPVNDKIWYTDPPASSYPACVAVKCAARQSQEAEELYLYQLRKAVMIDGKNIARKEVLLEAAASVAENSPGLLDIPLFEKELACPAVIHSFKEDLQETSYQHITRFPTLMIRRPGKKGLLAVTGNRPYDAIAGLLDRYMQS